MFKEAKAQSGGAAHSTHNARSGQVDYFGDILSFGGYYIEGLMCQL